LKTNVIEIRPKIFTDKPTEKQLDMTFETKMQVMNSSAFRKLNDMSSQSSMMSIDTKQKSQSYMPKNKLLQDPDEIMFEKQKS
jgi:hypothetical protein